MTSVNPDFQRTVYAAMIMIQIPDRMKRVITYIGLLSIDCNYIYWFMSVPSRRIWDGILMERSFVFSFNLSIMNNCYNSL